MSEGRSWFDDSLISISFVTCGEDSKEGSRPRYQSRYIMPFKPVEISIIVGVYCTNLWSVHVTWDWLLPSGAQELCCCFSKGTTRGEHEWLYWVISVVVFVLFPATNLRNSRRSFGSISTVVKQFCFSFLLLRQTDTSWRTTTTVLITDHMAATRPFFQTCSRIPIRLGHRDLSGSAYHP